MHSVEAQMQDNLARLYHAHRTMLEAAVRSIVHDPIRAEEACANLMVTLIHSGDTYDESRPFPPWARTIAYRIAADALKQQAREAYCLEQLAVERALAPIDDMGPESKLDREAEALHRCLARLPAKHRQLIEHRFWNDLEYPRIAPLMGKSVAALQVMFGRLRRVLGKCVRRQLDSQ
jgi:RNA polymerase sigma factor (sigma-70 family)